MSQELLYISILVLILFLMYVYKKKCDEDYYLSIINSTQQYILQNQQRPNYLYEQRHPFYNNSFPVPMTYNNSYDYNFNNYYNSFKSPNSRTNSQIYYNNNKYNNNLPYDINGVSPSPILNKNENYYGYHNNGNRRHIMEDQILFNKVNNINDIDINNNKKIHNYRNNEYEENNYRFPRNNLQNYNNNYVNKKVIKLEDFLSGKKRNNLNDKFNKVANDENN